MNCKDCELREATKQMIDCYDECIETDSESCLMPLDSAIEYCRAKLLAFD